MLTGSLESGTAEEKGEEVVPRVETRGRERGRVGSCEDLCEGAKIVKNNQSPSTGSPLESNEMVEAAAMDNRNIMKIIIGGKTYMTLFHPGATISLVGPRLAKRFEQRLEETSGQVKGVTSSPVKIKGILRINLDVVGCTRPDVSSGGGYRTRNCSRNGFRTIVGH